MPAGGNHSTDHSALVKACIEYLQVHGAWTFKVLGGLGQKPGVMDVLAVLHGRAIGVEVKTGRARLSSAQVIEAASMRQAGALVVEVRALEQLEDALVDAGLVKPALYRRQEA